MCLEDLLPERNRKHGNSNPMLLRQVTAGKMLNANMYIYLYIYIYTNIIYTYMCDMCVCVR